MGCTNSSISTLPKNTENGRNRRMSGFSEDSQYEDDQPLSSKAPIMSNRSGGNKSGNASSDSENDYYSPRHFKKRTSSGLNEYVKRKSTLGQGGFSRMNFIATNKGRIDDFYKIQPRQIGTGSYGSVRSGSDRSTGQERAIKTILKRSMTNSRQFIEEMQIMSVLDHPNIIKMYESFEDSRNIYIVMEICSGGELFDKIVECGNFTERVAAVIMKQVLSAIHYMHGAGICHRDLKPENFLLKYDNDDLAENSIKIIDFGLSKQFEPGVKMTTKVCTPYYVAPEVLRGRYDEKCDIWSCEVILYVMLCGYPPFDGDNDDEVLKSILKGSYSFDGPEWQIISRDVQGLIRRMFLTPDIRANAHDCLTHKWIVNLAPSASNAVISAEAFSNLKNFNSQNKLKRMALTVIAGQLDESSIAHLREMFIKLDADGDGTLDVDEMREGFEKCGIDPPPNLVELMENVDSDGSGRIDYSEFLASTLDQRQYEAEDVCWAAFRVFDLDGNGRISQEELALIINGMNDNASVALGLHEEDIAQIMTEVDTNRDGEIDFEEFKAMMKGKGNLK